MKMKLIKKYIVVLMTMVFVVPCCDAAEEVDHLEQVYYSKFPKMDQASSLQEVIPIKQQLDLLDPFIRKAIAVGRPLVIAFGANQLERHHFNLSKYDNPFVIYIQNWVATIPRDDKTLQRIFNEKTFHDLYRAQTGLNTDPSYEELREFFIKELLNPFLIAADITRPELYEELSLRYPGCFDLITTDLGVTDKFAFSYDALAHYVRLLKDEGIMAFDIPHHLIAFGQDVHKEYVNIKKIKEEQYVKGIKSLRDYSLCERENFEESDDLTLEEKDQVWEWREENSKDFESKESIHSFVTRLLYINKERYRKNFGDMKLLPSPIHIFNVDYWRPFAFKCRQDEYDSLLSKVGEQETLEEYKTKLDEYHKTFFSDFFSQTGFDGYNTAIYSGLLPYVIEGEDIGIKYVVIQKK